MANRNKRSQALTTKDKLAVVGLGLIGLLPCQLTRFSGLAIHQRGPVKAHPVFVPDHGGAYFRSDLQASYRAHRLFALPISYAGIALVFLHDMHVLQHDAVSGSVLVFASALAYAVRLAGVGRTIARIGATRFTAYVMTVACVACLLQFAATYPVADLNLPC